MKKILIILFICIMLTSCLSTQKVYKKRLIENPTKEIIGQVIPLDYNCFVAFYKKGFKTYYFFVYFDIENELQVIIAEEKQISIIMTDDFNFMYKRIYDDNGDLLVHIIYIPIDSEILELDNPEDFNI